ncbi:unnamed protein product [Phytophthora lilii]|uniref:Unnamed protein product n=1 Tax=Phytophthora lilii TaxID=2077276 RepID=A0A9W6X1Y0_9STRA|nr:unnamed protein product [Phytophthora lilii]
MIALGSRCTRTGVVCCTDAAGRKRRRVVTFSKGGCGLEGTRERAVVTKCLGMDCPLETVALVLRHQPHYGELQYVAATICSFLGSAPSLSLSQACEFSSTKLLDWIWSCSCTSAADRTATWSLTNFLRSDPHYHRYQFAESMVVAARRSNLVTVRWLFAHFNGCKVPAKVPEIAARLGNLTLLEFLVENDAGDRPGEEVRGTNKTMQTDGGDNATTVNVVDREAIVKVYKAMRTRYPDVGSRVLERMREQQSEDESAILQALYCNNDERAMAMMPPGRCVLDYAAQCSRPDMVELMLDCGREVRDPQIVSSYGNLLTDCVRDDRSNTVKWLVEHIRFPEQGRPADAAINVAAQYGCFEILKLFHEMRSSEWVDLSLNEHSQADQVVVWWNRCQDAVNAAATGGQLEILQWLLANDLGKCSTSTMDCAASHGHLDVAQWLDTNSSEGCTTKAMDGAAANEHFDVVKWLHANRPEGCTSDAMDGAAARGYLDMVKWFQFNRQEGCTTAAMDMAAQGSHLEVIKWLYANRSEGCTVKAIENAVNDGHVGVANWLHTHFPDFYPASVTISTKTANAFESLLFLYANFAQTFGRYTKFLKIKMRRRFESREEDVGEWLAEHYPYCWKTRY